MGRIGLGRIGLQARAGAEGCRLRRVGVAGSAQGWAPRTAAMLPACTHNPDLPDPDLDPEPEPAPNPDTHLCDAARVQ